LSAQSYYNNFYHELSRLDEKGNNISKIEKFLPELSSGAKILDIGCGHGSVSRSLVPRGFDVYGMEINSDAIESLKRHGIKPIEHDISEPFNLRERFDLILLLDVLEHVFDPTSLISEAVKILKDDGTIIITIPLYFDLADRIRILFTGSIISHDNLCYGIDIYKRFRSYNYDHIRFFRPKDIYEMCELTGLKIKKVRYNPMGGFNLITKMLVRFIANKYTVGIIPNLLAHSMTLQVTK